MQDELEEDDILYTYLLDLTQVKTKCSSGSKHGIDSTPPNRRLASELASATKSVKICRRSTRSVKSDKVDSNMCLAQSDGKQVKPNCNNRRCKGVGKGVSATENALQDCTTGKGIKSSLACNKSPGKKTLAVNDKKLHHLLPVSGKQLIPNGSCSHSLVSITPNRKHVAPIQMSGNSISQNTVSVSNCLSRHFVRPELHKAMVSVEQSHSSVCNLTILTSVAMLNNNMITSLAGTSNLGSMVHSIPNSFPPVVHLSWSNPNLVIRTRRASMHCPVTFSSVPHVLHHSQNPRHAVVSPLPTNQVNDQLIGFVTSVGPVLTLTPQPLRIMTTGQPRVCLPVATLSISQACVFTPTVPRIGTSLQLVSMPTLQKSLIRLPDGSAAVLSHINGAPLGSSSPFIVGQTVGQSGSVFTGAQGSLPTSPCQTEHPSGVLLRPSTVNTVGTTVLPGNMVFGNIQLSGSTPVCAKASVSRSCIQTVVHLSASSGVQYRPVALRGMHFNGMPMGMNLIRSVSAPPTVRLPVVATCCVSFHGGAHILTPRPMAVVSPVSLLLPTQGKPIVSTVCNRTDSCTGKKGDG